MGNLRNFTLALLLFSAPVVHSSEPGPPHVDTVEQFVAAFNAQDSNAMAEFVSDDSWQGNSGRSAQKAISVYEFSGEKITRVYYFSAEK